MHIIVMIMIFLIGIEAIKIENKMIIDFCRNKTGLHSSDGLTIDCDLVNNETITRNVMT